MLFFQFTTRWSRGALYTAFCMVIQKLEDLTNLLLVISMGDASIVNCQFVKFNCTSNFLVIR